MSKTDRLAQVAAEIDRCRACPLFKTATHAVPGTGSSEADLMFIGEAPGYHEDQQGLPFVGAAGKLLDQLLASIDLKRSEVWIGNILKHRPPENRDPLPDEVVACQNFLDAQIEIINPRIIATLGRFSLTKFLPDARISQLHGVARYVEFAGARRIIFPLYHPAAALRNGAVMEDLKRDFLKLPFFLGRQAVSPSPAPAPDKPPPSGQMGFFN